MCITIYHIIGIVFLYLLSIFIAYKVGYKTGNLWGRDEGWMEGANREYLESVRKMKAGQ